MPVFGLGSWRMGEHSDRFQAEVSVIRAALELGVTLIDTAEMYGEGGAEPMTASAPPSPYISAVSISVTPSSNAARMTLTSA